MDGQTSTPDVFFVFSLAHLRTQYLVLQARGLNEEDELMKKRTLVCFLIFTLCVFYTAIPNTVFGQEEEASLAEQVYEKHSELLQRADIIEALPGALEELKKPEIQDLLTPATINIAVQSPDILAGRVPPEFITLLKEDQAGQGCVQ